MKKWSIRLLMMSLFMMVVGIQATPTPVVESEIPKHMAKYFVPMKEADILTGYPYSACSIDEKGNLWVWGNAKDGLFPVGTNHNGFRYETTGKYEPYLAWPTKVQSNVRQMTVDEHLRKAAFMVKEDNTLWAWGIIGSDYSLEGKDIKPIKIMDGVQSVEAHGGNVYSIKTDGTLWEFAYNKGYGVDDNVVDSFTKPTLLDTGVKQVSSAMGKTFWLKEDGSLWVRGTCYYGEICLGMEGTKEKCADQWFNKVKVMDHVAQVEAARYHTAVLKQDGTVWTWGGNQHGQLGQGPKKPLGQASAPAKIIEGVKKIAVDESHGVALKEDGSVWSWGSNNYGEVGNGQLTERRESMQDYITVTDRAVLTPVKIRDRIKDISAGTMGTLAVTEEGVLLEWGNRIVHYFDHYALIPEKKMVTERE